MAELRGILDPEKSKDILRLKEGDSGLKYNDTVVLDGLVKADDISKERLDMMRQHFSSDKEILHYLMTGETWSDPGRMSRGELQPRSWLGGGPLETHIRGAGSIIIDLLGDIADTPTKLINAQLGQIAPTRTREGSLPRLLEEPNIDEKAKSWLNPQMQKLTGLAQYFPENIMSLPPEKRPAYASGEAIGSGMLFLFPIKYAGKLGLLGKFGRETQKRTWMTQEMSSIFASGSLAYLGEKVDPGGYGRFAGEFVGGFLNPASWFAKGVNSFSLKFSDRVRSLMGEEDAVAREWIVQALKDAGEIKPGESPADFAERLRIAAGGDVEKKMPLAFRTESPTLIKMQRQFAQESGEYAEWLTKSMNETYREMDRTIWALREAATLKNDEKLFQMAAELEIQQYETFLNINQGMAEQKILEATSGLGAARDATAFSGRVSRIIDLSIKDGRKIETEVWNLVDRNAPINNEQLTPIIEAFESAKAERLNVPADRLPALVEQQVDQFRQFLDQSESAEDVIDGLSGWIGVEDLVKQGEPIELNTGTLITLRSRMLELHRQSLSGSNPDFAAARDYLSIANATEEAIGMGDPTQIYGYDRARAYSRMFNDRFRRSFIGDITGVKTTGDERVSPEVILARMNTGGPDETFRRIKDVEKAVAFPGRAQRRFGVVDPETGQRLVVPSRSIKGIQEEYLKNAAYKFFPKGAREFDVDAYRRWKLDNAEVLEQFPDLYSRLETAEKAQRWLAGMKNWPETNDVDSAKELWSRFARASTEFPDKEIAEMFAGPRPQQDYAKLAEATRAVAKKSNNAGYLRGLKGHTIDSVFNKAVLWDEAKKDWVIDWTAIRKGFVEPDGSRPSVLSIMTQNGVMPQYEANRWKALIDAASKMQIAVEKGALIDNTTSAFQDFAVRVLGVRIAKILPMTDVGGPGQLQVAAAASQYARQVWEKLPFAKLTNAMMKLTQDEDAFRLAMRSYRGDKDRMEIANKLNVWLFSSLFSLPTKLEGQILEDPYAGVQDNRSTPLPVMP